jgi:hypothetical protein
VAARCEIFLDASAELNPGFPDKASPLLKDFHKCVLVDAIPASIDSAIGLDTTHVPN